MKIQYFLRGLGLGIVVCAFVLFVAYKTNPPKMSDQEIKKAAKGLGMVEATSTEDSLAALREDSTSEDTTESVTTEKEMTTEASTEATTEMITTEASTTEVVTTEQSTEASGEDKTIVITVTAGMYSDAVAESLYNMGLVDSASAFDQYLNANGYGDRILVGDHTIKVGATYDQIAQSLTTR